MPGWTGQKAGYCFLWHGWKKVGDDFQPETYELEAPFDLPDYKVGTHCYLQLKTRGVHYRHNALFINGVKVADLSVYPSWLDVRETPLAASEVRQLSDEDHRGFLETFFIDAGTTGLKAGPNTFKIVSRDKDGEAAGNVDDFAVRDPILLYGMI